MKAVPVAVIGLVAAASLCPAQVRADMPAREFKFLQRGNSSLCGIVEDCGVPLPRPKPHVPFGGPGRHWWEHDLYAQALHEEVLALHPTAFDQQIRSDGTVTFVTTELTHHHDEDFDEETTGTKSVSWICRIGGPNETTPVGCKAEE